MNNSGNSLPIISLIFAIAGLFLMGFANIDTSIMMIGGLIFSIVSLPLAIYSVIKVDSKKWCSVIAIILCIITFFMYSLF